MGVTDSAGGLPPLSELLSWGTDHLYAGAASLEQTADLWENTTTSMWRDVHSVGWEGRAAESAKTRLTGDKNQAAAGADRLRAAARAARTGAPDVLRAQNGLRYAINDAAEAGFNVYDDYTVEDPDGDSDPQPYADAIHQRAKELVGVDNHVGRAMNDAAGDMADHFFDESNGSGVQLVDHHTRTDGDGAGRGALDRLGLPDYADGSLSTDDARAVYTRGELQMRELNDQLAREGMSVEDRARVMSDTRNELRSWVRDLMADRDTANALNANEPNQTFDQLVARNAAKGYTGDDIYQKIIESSTRSRPSVNDALGIDPEHPPPLPPVIPPKSLDPSDGGWLFGEPNPLVTQVPQGPTVLNHPPVAELPPHTDLPLTDALSGVLEHPLPDPWLWDPSPPGFDLSPNEPPLTFTWSAPDPNVPVLDPGTTGSTGGGLQMPSWLHAPHVEPLTPEQQRLGAGATGVTALGLLAILGLLVAA